MALARFLGIKLENSREFPVGNFSVEKASHEERGTNETCFKWNRFFTRIASFPRSFREVLVNGKRAFTTEFL